MPRYRWTTSRSSNVSLQVGTGVVWELSVLNLNLQSNEFVDPIGNTVEREVSFRKYTLFMISVSHVPLKVIFIEQSVRALVYLSRHSYLVHACLILGNYRFWSERQEEPSSLPEANNLPSHSVQLCSESAIVAPGIVRPVLNQGQHHVNLPARHGC